MPTTQISQYSPFFKAPYFLLSNGCLFKDNDNSDSKVLQLHWTASCQLTSRCGRLAQRYKGVAFSAPSPLPPTQSECSFALCTLFPPNLPMCSCCCCCWQLVWDQNLIPQTGCLQKRLLKIRGYLETFPHPLKDAAQNENLVTRKHLKRCYQSYRSWP